MLSLSQRACCHTPCHTQAHNPLHLIATRAAPHSYLRRLPFFTRGAVRLLRPEEHDVAVTLTALVKELRRVPDVHEALASWFCNSATPADIKRGNAAELFSYAVFYRTRCVRRGVGLAATAGLCVVPHAPVCLLPTPLHTTTLPRQTPALTRQNTTNTNAGSRWRRKACCRS